MKTIQFKMKQMDEMKNLIQINENGICKNFSEERYLLVEFSDTNRYAIHPNAIEMFFYNISISDYAFYRLASSFDLDTTETYEYNLDDDLYDEMINKLNTSIEVDEDELGRSFDIGNNIDTTLSNGYGNESFVNFDNNNEIYFTDIFRNVNDSDSKITEIVKCFEKIHLILTGNNII